MHLVVLMQLGTIDVEKKRRHVCESFSNTNTKSVFFILLQQFIAHR